ncbi:MAG: NAD(+) synthase [Anaerolineales bacterium]|nr:NAD(+) synthase [Anaerolineales bacterium]
MKIGLAQINPTIGDLEGNVERCRKAAAEAAAGGADLVVLPEMAIPGYPPRDLLCDARFVDAVLAATDELAELTRHNPPVLVGSLMRSGQTLPGHPGLFNVAYQLAGGRKSLAAVKRLLPAYDVFHEPRWFLPGPFSPALKIGAMQIGVLICEDLWDEGYPLHPPADLRSAGAELLVCLSALPFRRGTLEKRLVHARRTQMPLALVSLCGANDELIFDGRSLAINADGELLTMLAAFDEDVQVVDFSLGKPADAPPPPEGEQAVFQALVLGVRDFARKNGVEQVVVGLSGGIDSSVVAVIAAQALGPRKVTGIAIPSRFTDPRSTASAQELAQRLGIHFERVELETLHQEAERSLQDLLSEEAPGVAENIQARLRMVILMSFVNRYGGMLLNTGNKSELALGYSTLYGDMAGTLSPLGDLTKPEVYSLARWINTEHGQVIPAFVLERPPSAELRPDQVDPFDYDDLAPQIEKLILNNQSNALMKRTEHKRWQMGVILKVSEKAFGSGRMIPITKK